MSTPTLTDDAIETFADEIECASLEVRATAAALITVIGSARLMSDRDLQNEIAAARCIASVLRDDRGQAALSALAEVIQRGMLTERVRERFVALGPDLDPEEIGGLARLLRGYASRDLARHFGEEAEQERDAQARARAGARIAAGHAREGARMMFQHHDPVLGGTNIDADDGQSY